MPSCKMPAQMACTSSNTRVGMRGMRPTTPARCALLLCTPRFLLRQQHYCSTRQPVIAAAAAVEAPPTRTPGSKQPSFPFVKIAGQEDMKLALMLNVIDSNIGGVLIMGDRGTAKSVIVRGHTNFVVVSTKPTTSSRSVRSWNSSP